MRVFVVVNPRSGGGRTGRRWVEIQAQLARRLNGFSHAFTQRPMDALHLSRKALQDGYDCIVAVGGDGTINEVVNGFFGSNGEPPPNNACLAVLPRGTGGDFRKTFGWKDEVESGVARIASGQTVPLDVGELQFTLPDGSLGRRYFVNVCSFGVGGKVVQQMNQSSKLLGGRLGFMVASAKALLKYSDKPVTLRADDGEPESMQITSVAVANGRYFGGGMQVAPDASPSDGLFDVTIWRGYGLTDFALKSKALYDGGHVRLSGTRTFRCTRLWAESKEEVLLDVDGEQPGRLPCSMTILPGALRLKI